MAGKLNLDKLDLQIIQEMTGSAEISYADLGKKLFVSGGTIHVRIKKLQELGIVKGTKLNVDLKQLGYDVIAFIGIYLEKSSMYDAVAKEFGRPPVQGIGRPVHRSADGLRIRIRIFDSRCPRLRRLIFSLH